MQKYNIDTLCVCDLIFKLNIPPKLKSPFGRDGCAAKKEVPLFSKGCNYSSLPNKRPWSKNILFAQNRYGRSLLDSGRKFF